MRGAGKRTEHDRHRQSVSSSMTLDSHNDECSRFHLFMGGTILLLISIEWPVARLVRLEGFGQLRHCIFGTATLLTVIAYCHWRNYYRLRESAILAVWLVWLTITLNILMQICGRSPAPLVLRPRDYVTKLVSGLLTCKLPLDVNPVAIHATVPAPSLLAQASDVSDSAFA